MHEVVRVGSPRGGQCPWDKGAEQRALPVLRTQEGLATSGAGRSSHRNRTAQHLGLGLQPPELQETTSVV